MDENQTIIPPAGDTTPPADVIPPVGDTTPLANVTPPADTTPPADVIPPVKSLEDQVAELAALVAKQSDTITMLSSIADRGRLETYQNKRRVVPAGIVTLSTLDGKIVTAWRTVIDEVWKDSDGVYHEEQQVALTTEDGEEHVMRLIDRIRQVKSIPATIVSRTRVNLSDDGSFGESLEEVFVVKLEDGRQLEISNSFINA